jgi:hypothetical protein
VKRDVHLLPETGAITPLLVLYSPRASSIALFDGRDHRSFLS